MWVEDEERKVEGEHTTIYKDITNLFACIEVTATLSARVVVTKALIEYITQVKLLSANNKEIRCYSLSLVSSIAVMTRR